MALQSSRRASPGSSRVALTTSIRNVGLGIGVSFLEMLVMFLQAYVFTLLSAMYIGEALADEH